MKAPRVTRPVMLVTTAALSLFGCIAAVVLLTNAGQVESSEAWSDRAHLVLEGLSDILVAADDAETGGRGFLLTDEATFLQPYYSGLSKGAQSLALVQNLTKDTPDQQANVEVLRRLLGEKFADLDRSIEYERAGKKQAAIDSLREGKNIALMDEIRKTVSMMISEEQHLLQKRRDMLLGLNERAFALVIILLVAGGAGVLLGTRQVSGFFARQRSEKIVREHEGRLRHFIDHAPVAIAMFDKDMRFLAVSRRFLSDYRIEGEAPIGQSHYDVFPEISDDWRAIHVRVLAGETLSSEAEAFLRTDGSVNWIRWEMAPWRQTDGTIDGATLFTEDITERKAAEAAMLRGEARLRLVQQISGIAYTDWMYLEPTALSSPEFADIYGLPAGQTRVAIHEFIGLIHPDDRARIAGITPESIGPGGSVASEFRICRKDGQVRWISARMEAFPGPSGLLERVVSAHQDITDVVAAREKLADQLAEVTRLSRHLAQARDRADLANRAKSRFLAGMSHELRTPLSGILGYAQLLQMEGGLNETQRARLDAMQGAGKHLLQMITCVLDLSEIEAEHVELQAVEFDVQSVAEACMDLIRPASEAKGLALGIVVAPGTRRELVGDPTRLRQVLLNLLGNAAKFTATGSIEVRLGQAADGSVLRIEVVDTGAGIPAEQRQRLFNDFERLDTEATRLAEGAGLGLALSFRLAGLMGGHLGHEDNPGGGSVFWLELPLNTPSMGQSAFSAASDDSNAPAVALPVRPLRVLVADDALVNRDIAEAFLRAAGHQVTCAEDGAEAVAAVASQDFDVVLMDVRMPNMDGLEATRRIRAMDGPRGMVPIVALTAQAFTDQVEACRKAGMNSHLVKPYDMERLLSAVTQAAVWRQQRDVASDSMATPGALPDDSAIRVVDVGPPVLNRHAFEQTTAMIAPEKVAVYMRIISERGVSLLRDLRETGGTGLRGNELAEAAHSLAGSASMFGFERLAAAGRSFERAVQSDAAETPAIARALCDAVEATLKEIELAG